MDSTMWSDCISTYEECHPMKKHHLEKKEEKVCLTEFSGTLGRIVISCPGSGSTLWNCLASLYFRFILQLYNVIFRQEMMFAFCKDWVSILVSSFALPICQLAKGHGVNMFEKSLKYFGSSLILLSNSKRLWLGMLSFRFVSLLPPELLRLRKPSVSICLTEPCSSHLVY